MDLLINEKDLGLTSLAILAAGLIFLINKWPKDIHHTFSQHAATNTVSVIYYASLFAIVLPMLAVFLFFWLVPTFNISLGFTILIGLSLVCQYACTLVPEVGKKVRHHQVLAGVSGLLLLPSLIIFTFVPHIDAIDRFIAIICVAVMVVIITLAARHKAKYALLLQSVYFIAFFTPIVVISYV